MIKTVLHWLGVYLIAMIVVTCFSFLFSPNPEESQTAYYFGESEGEETADNEISQPDNEMPFDFSVNVKTVTEAEKETAVETYPIHQAEPNDLTADIMTELEKRRKNKKKGGGVMSDVFGLAVLRLRDKNGNIVTIPAVRGEKGSTIQSIERTAGDGSPGTTDTYTLTMSGGEIFHFNVYNGADGKTHKPGDHILIGENDEISVDMAQTISEGEARPISADLALQVFQKATSAVKMTTGSYVGTGEFGENSPVSITFDFIPKFVLIAMTHGGNVNHIMWITGCQAMLRKTDAEYTIYTLPATLTDKTLTFYHASDASKQFNAENVPYYYLALG